jgi:hypothetical protein
LRSTLERIIAICKAITVSVAMMDGIHPPDTRDHQPGIPVRAARI